METETLHGAINKFGVISQMDMAIEEAAELIQAINKVKRSFTSEQICLFYRINHTPQMPAFQDSKDALIYQNICGEIADMKIMLSQLELIFNRDTINLIVDRKLNRLQERING